MVLEQLEKIKRKSEVKSLHESIFWDEEDIRWQYIGKVPEVRADGNDVEQVVDISKDAYIWAFTGTRGAGKSIAMTYFAAKAVYLYGTRIIANYPIAFNLTKDGKTTYHEAEPLDMYKLLCFDKNYQHCLILIDEAPDVISHMASMTWKNRLLNIFVRQLRKNMNSLFLGCQQLGLIDKSMRWQTDIVVRCQDAFRLYGASQGLDRGSDILLDIYDNSGQWTGEGANIDWDEQLKFTPADAGMELPGRLIWGAFDTYHHQDVFDSLKRVDMKLGAYKIGGETATTGYFESAKDICLAIEGTVKTVELYDSIGEGTDGEKKKIGSWLRKSGVITSADNKYKDFSHFDKDKFLRLMSKGK